MKRGRTLPLSGRQLVVLVELMRATRRANTNTLRALVRLGLAMHEHTEIAEDGITPRHVPACATEAARLLLDGRTFLAPLDVDAASNVAARYAVVDACDVVAFVYVYRSGRRVLSPIESAGRLAVTSSSTNLLPRWFVHAVERVALDLDDERPGARKAIDVSDVVERARAAHVKAKA